MQALIFSGVIVPETSSRATGLALRNNLASAPKSAAVKATTSVSLIHEAIGSPLLEYFENVDGTN
jgi:hypothetical protein